MDPFVGEIRLFSGSFAPKNWAFCQGQLLPIQQNVALYSLLGTNYGGDGRSTFGLPNLQVRVPLGSGQNPNGSAYFLGQVGGEATHALTVGEMPAHVHNLAGDNVNANSTSPSGSLPGKGPNRSSALYSAAGAPVPMAAGAIGASGSGVAHNNLQAFLALNYIIALVGIFPQRP